jgi:hypothetical protein
MSDLPSSPLRIEPDPQSLLSAEKVAGVPASTGTVPSDAALQDAFAGNLDSAAPTGTMPRQGDQDAWSEVRHRLAQALAAGALQAARKQLAQQG